MHRTDADLREYDADSPEDYLIADIYSLETMICDCRELIRRIKENNHTRRLNTVDRKLGEVEDEIEELLEKGI